MKWICNKLNKLKLDKLVIQNKSTLSDFIWADIITLIGH